MILVVGIGQCGGNLLAAFMRKLGGSRPVRQYVLPISVNSNSNDQRGIERFVPRTQWVGVTGQGEVIRAARPKGTVVGYEGQVAGGLGKHFDLGYEVFLKAEDKLAEIVDDMLRDRPGASLEQISMAVVMAGLGKGTGSGGTPVLLKMLQRLRIPTLVVVVLPSHEEEGNVQTAQNAIKSLARVVDRLEWRSETPQGNLDMRYGLIVVDNSVVAGAGKSWDAMVRYNDYVAGCLYDFVVAPAVGRIGVTDKSERVMDVQDMIGALRWGELSNAEGLRRNTFVGALGRASYPMERFLPFTRPQFPQVEPLVHTAMDHLTIAYEGEEIHRLACNTTVPLKARDFPHNDLERELNLLCPVVIPGYTPTNEKVCRVTVCASFRREHLPSLVRLRATAENVPEGEVMDLGEDGVDPLADWRGPQGGH